MLDTVRSRTHAVRRLLPLVLLLIVPLGAFAGLASRDLSGVPRTSPTTIGGLEAGTAVAVTVLPAPGNLRVALRTS
ncbi:MAG: hypothetical protein ACJ8NR_07565 [Sulfurifustis sp.]